MLGYSPSLVALTCSLNYEEEALVIKPMQVQPPHRYYPPHPMLQMAYNSDTAPDYLYRVVVEVLRIGGIKMKISLPQSGFHHPPIKQPW